ncbi:hypothetical protein CALVIDRAFT_567513 [Calocera viscosa TUFC12733]|uniref:Uncharacterized protein n=1 Tax=Calocera viscosa (strain TUFC12733) TaxID=1330018 RepID=A0A167I4D8_CALVF|nr:hypothetical protein CALVIDRAFT_567513 [Calocera viscosa TUFC12733]
MFARQLANTSRRALAQRSSFAARRSIHLESEPRPWGMFSELPPNGIYLAVGTTIVSAVGLYSGVKTWLMEPEDFAEGKRAGSLLRH